MAIDTLENVQWLDGQDLLFVNDTQLIYHCHHFNLFFDQTIDDALGHEEGQRLRTQAAQVASRHMLCSLKDNKELNTPAEVIAIAQKLFASMGQGNLDLSVSADGGTAEAAYLHYGFSWKEKYGASVKRKHPADAMAAGFAAAATEVAYDLPAGTIKAIEQKCVATRDERCRFVLTRVNQPLEDRPFTAAECESLLGPTLTGLDEERVAGIAAGLKDFTSGVGGDARGLIQAFGVFVSRNAASYYNHISFEAVQAMAAIDASLESTAEELLRESGRQCGFNTFGGILRSAEWESLVSAPTSNPREILTSCCAIARALGFGHWTLTEFDAGRRFVIKTPATYETGYYRKFYGKSAASRSYILQGAAIAMAHLAHEIRWEEHTAIDSTTYSELMAGKSDWSWEMPTCHSCGDEVSEIVVTRA